MTVKTKYTHAWESDCYLLFDNKSIVDVYLGQDQSISSTLLVKKTGEHIELKEHGGAPIESGPMSLGIPNKTRSMYFWAEGELIQKQSGLFDFKSSGVVRKWPRRASLRSERLRGVTLYGDNQELFSIVNIGCGGAKIEPLDSKAGFKSALNLNCKIGDEPMESFVGRLGREGTSDDGKKYSVIKFEETTDAFRAAMQWKVLNSLGRRSLRKNCSIDCQLFVGDKKVDALIVNISGSGVLLKNQSSLIDVDKGRLSFSFEHKKYDVEVLFTRRYENLPNYCFGLEFVGMTDVDRESIIRFVITGGTLCVE